MNNTQPQNQKNDPSTTKPTIADTKVADAAKTANTAPVKPADATTPKSSNA